MAAAACGAAEGSATNCRRQLRHHHLPPPRGGPGGCGDGPGPSPPAATSLFPATPPLAFPASSGGTAPLPPAPVVRSLPLAPRRHGAGPEPGRAAAARPFVRRGAAAGAERAGAAGRAARRRLTHGRHPHRLLPAAARQALGETPRPRRALRPRERPSARPALKTGHVESTITMPED
ncbi:uncharacterized protein LJ264_001568 isoform 2-T2 [Porphyrio hochstetteri]